MSTLKKLNEQKDVVVEKMRDVLAKCQTESRGFHADEKTEYANLQKDLESLREKISGVYEYETALANMSTIDGEEPESRSLTVSQEQKEKPISAEERAEAFRTWACSSMPDIAKNLKPHQIESAERCGYNFRQMHITKKAPPLQRMTEKRFTNNVASNVDAAASALGGYTVPDDMMMALQYAVKEFGGMFSAATLLTTSTGRPLPIPTVNDTGNVGELVAEEGAVATKEYTFGQVVLEGWKYSSKIVRCSREFLQDTSINVPEFIGRSLGERIARIVHTDLTTGSGSSKPKGLTACVTVHTTEMAVDNAPTYAELLTLIHLVDPAWRKSSKCGFMTSDTVLANIEKIVDSQNRPLFLPSMISGTPNTLFGYPLIINQDMPTAGAGGTESIAFGDFSQYYIRQSDEIEILQLNELYAANGQVGFVAFERWDGDLLHQGTGGPIATLGNKT